MVESHPHPNHRSGQKIEVPPGLCRSNQPYTALFCEENVWQLCQNRAFAEKKRHVIFISNQARQCPMWLMRAADADDQPVFWDYHVILLTESPVLVWDLDSLLPFPVTLEQYLAASFRQHLPTDFEPSFRVVAGDTYAKYFASDRSHMLAQNGDWLAPPPSWPCINEHFPHNLDKFIDMTKPAPGEVHSLASLAAKFDVILRQAAVLPVSDTPTPHYPMEQKQDP